MADISMCADRKCPSRVHCYRYRARANSFWQSYMNPERPADAQRCDYYETTGGWGDRNLTPMKELENE